MQNTNETIKIRNWNKHLLQICHDMGLTRYEDSGYTVYQAAPEKYPEKID